ncbi:ArsR/SmtB family transcription factor [Thermoflavimicrobium daqui]|uniref:Transcriptional regulator n=1 Tax=Thermoflavimicrobium daqui TaxID=2137476 RepID=A0A364K1N6_9BACL|nr:metalloregulator ArsR/SmtB family transcription factor [Thermoflavimicrobium daqui]RAL21941.1 transcriptional regulator [Thermoflavimicrobium daqui]
MSTDHCEIYCYDQEKVKRVQTSLETVDPIDTAQIFKALADPTRLKIAYALVQEDELCVCDVANIIQSSLPTASHHLRLLRNMGLAKYRKEGKLVFYSLDDDHIKLLVRLAFDHSEELASNGANSR